MLLLLKLNHHCLLNYLLLVTLFYIVCIYQGYQVYKDWGDGKGFVHLQVSLHADFVDNSLLPIEGITQTWRYKVIYYLKGEQVGNFSNIVSVTVKWME